MENLYLCFVKKKRLEQFSSHNVRHGNHSQDRLNVFVWPWHQSRLDKLERVAHKQIDNTFCCCLNEEILIFLFIYTKYCLSVQERVIPLSKSTMNPLMSLCAILCISEKTIKDTISDNFFKHHQNVLSTCCLCSRLSCNLLLLKCHSHTHRRLCVTLWLLKERFVMILSQFKWFALTVYTRSLHVLLHFSIVFVKIYFCLSNFVQVVILIFTDFREFCDLKWAILYQIVIWIRMCCRFHIFK